jgi:DNA transformation protein
MLARAGIATVHDLRKEGSVDAFVAVKKTGQPVSLNLLWALEGALTDQHWKEIGRTERTCLLLALGLLESIG